ncbi:helix-turn-helix domain-containing protein [Streptomyces sp. NBC_01808]|uniref:helix-turn-helix domain-containing protein n=1 Tax=Streptomyces sp. NBC_01808 TaxID=2975947 RepID=UPI002DDA20BD|nr:helix-turn-helix transcriptional regulator [Streptomyces sp. NBC_01808]WSA40080.1 helix-turn-helix domain-containing protein [Streptomyces sp. NBC_01808]
MHTEHSNSLWDSVQARRLVDRQEVGRLLRLGRVDRGWRQADLGARIGCSASTVSRLENHSRIPDLALLRQAARAVGLPTRVLARALGLQVSATTVTTRQQSRPLEDPLRRRTLLAATSLAPAHLLASFDDALAATPDATGSAVPAGVRLAEAQRLYDTSRYATLIEALPTLLGDLHARARSGGEPAQARLSACYTLATHTLSKIGAYGQARLSGDRAATYAELSGFPLAQAAAARCLGIVLRHQDHSHAAQLLTRRAVEQLERSGLRDRPHRAAYVQMLATTAYTAARAGRREEALTTLAEAQDASRGLPAQAPAANLSSITPAAVELYAVGVHRALGDSGAALQAGKTLRPEHFPTAERRGRFHTDMGRAWWQSGRPEQTARALLAAHRVAPAEVRNRPAIRSIVTDLARRHPHTIGVKELATAVAEPAF